MKYQAAKVHQISKIISDKFRIYSPDFSLMSSSTNLTGLFPQYVYGEVEGYLSAIGSTLNQMERSEL